MVVKYGETMFDVSMLERKVGSLRSGDLIFYQGAMWEIETIQKDCIDFHNHSFIMVILDSADGARISLRNGLNDKATVYRKRKQVSK